VITSSQIIFFLLDSINKHYPWLQAHEFYNFSLTLVSSLLDFLICGSHCCRVLSNFILVSLPTSIIFLGFLLLFLQTLQIVSYCVILFLLLQIPLSSFITTYVPFITWWHFMLLDVRTSSSWYMIQGQPLFLNIVCAICLFFNQVLYIYLRMFHMILITLSQVLHTKFLRPPCKGDNGWLVAAVIALLVVAWLIVFKKPLLQ